MKNLKIKKGALRIRQASLVLDTRKTLQAVKLNETEAFSPEVFSKKFKDYPLVKRLEFGEKYEGYIAIWHLGRPEINFLRGTLELQTERAIWNTWINDLVREERYLRVDGSLEYVWAFADCSSEMMDTVKEKLTTALRMFADCSSEMMDTVKEKLTTALRMSALTGDDPIARLTDEEDANLKKYLGSSYYKAFFTELED